MKPILAIDPGQSGGFAWRHIDSMPDREIVHCQPMPETEGDIIASLRSCVAAHNIKEAYVEDVGKGVMPGRAIPMIALNVNAAVIRTTLACCGVRVVMVRPQIWQASFGLGKRSSCASAAIWKNKLKAEAQRRFPDADVTLKTADALLIFEYAQKQN